MEAVKKKLHVVRVLLHGIPFRRRTARAKMDAVGRKYPAVDESSPAVEETSHGIYFEREGGRVQRGVMPENRSVVGFHPTFSRHGIAQILSALALLIWLDEKVRF